MKKLLFTLMAIMTTVVSANAMDFEQARERALFLTDKMAYELNLTDDQYEAVYEVNLDYFLGIRSEADIDGVYWSNRNTDLYYILADWQYRAFSTALYFYRPLYWSPAGWHFRIYARYPRRTFFYFSRPVCYVSYNGGHSWRHNGGSWYRGRTYGVAHRPGGDGKGMRDNYRGTRNHGSVATGNRGNVGAGNRGNVDAGYRGNHGNVTTGNRTDNRTDRGNRSDNHRPDNGRNTSTGTGVQPSTPQTVGSEGGNRGSSGNRTFQERGSSTRRSYDNAGTRYGNTVTAPMNNGTFSTKGSSVSTPRSSSNSSSSVSTPRSSSVSSGSSVSTPRSSVSTSRSSSGSSRSGSMGASRSSGSRGGSRR